MGDRRNIELRYSDDDPTKRVFLYTHWEGSQLPYTLASALDSNEGRNRWSDPDYLARIIFSRMTEGSNAETGFGIAPYQMDQNYPNIVVDLIKQTVDGTPYEQFIEEAKVLGGLDG